MRLVSWNVNGLRACMKKGFADFFEAINADIVCLQETKCCREDMADCDFSGYHQYWNSAQKRGYSGTALFSRREPLSFAYGIDALDDSEGRVITAEYGGFYMVCCYSPNARAELSRLPYRMAFEDALRDYLCRLDRRKPVILCGDLNVAHEEIDLKNPAQNIGNPGFSYEEREKFSDLLDAGFIDTFRFLYPDAENAYSWWSYRSGARSRNVGWRIDYFVASERLRENILHSSILSEVMGSDHCPVMLEVDIPF